jgi:site-specific recombinase XerC
MDSPKPRGGQEKVGHWDLRDQHRTTQVYSILTHLLLAEVPAAPHPRRPRGQEAAGEDGCESL